MKQTLALKLGQQLTMTPQLQQAIKLLQLSALDLQQEIQATLEANPMLELELDGDGDEGGLPDDSSVQDDIDSSAQHTDDLANSEVQSDHDDGASNEYADDYASPHDLGDEGSIGLNAPDAFANETDVTGADGGDIVEPGVNDQLQQEMGEEMPVDTSWEDVYPTASSLPAGDSDFDPMANRSSDANLSEHLLWQLNLCPMAASDQVIALAIIDSLEPSGLLNQSTEEICAALQDENLPVDERVTHEDVSAVLERIQQFDPIGVAARDLSECLLLQLAPLPLDTPWLEEARELVREHLDLLGSKDFATLRRRTKLSDSELAEAVALIRTLNPRPGFAIAEEAADYIVPDVVVRKFEGRWIVELNAESTPQVRINPLYEKLSKEVKQSADKEYMRDHLQDAKWFLKSLQTRHDTLLRVASKIVEVQRGFLDYGPEAMKPLILADIAEAVDLHESTISRVTTRKYMSTPRGVFELKYFFSSHVGTATGGEVSSTAIRALIEKLTADEDRKKPLSDSKIAAILKEQNINVARRTVAKYRESLSIPPSNERKQLA